MKILALERECPDAQSEDFAPLLREEALALWRLMQEGVVREHYFDADRHTAVLMLEASNLEEAVDQLRTLPLVSKGLIEFELIPLAPYSGYERLFAAADGGGKTSP